MIVNTLFRKIGTLYASLCLSCAIFAQENPIIYGYTGVDNANIVKAKSIREIIKSKKITLKEMHEKLGKPVSLSDIGFGNLVYTYKGIGKVVYLFELENHEPFGGEIDELGNMKICSIILCMRGMDKNEMLVLWGGDKIFNKIKVESQEK